MTSDPFRKYYDKLEKKEDFVPLLKQFIHRSIAEQYKEETNTDPDAIPYSQFYEKFVESVFSVNVENVFNFCQSPIERIFLNSFMLLFLKNKMPCIFITHPFKDTELELKSYREYFKSLAELIQSYKEVTGDNNLIFFKERLKKKQEQGEYTAEQVEDTLMYNSLLKTFEFNSYHITPQAAFPNLKVEDKSVRADFFIWVPNDPSVKIIVECDGFQYHSSKTSFVNDKKRDRIFQLNGYRVIRYSGTEIYNNPVQVSSDLFDLLDAIDDDKDSKRVL